MRFEKLIKRTVIFGIKALKIRRLRPMALHSQSNTTKEDQDQDQDQDRKQAITSNKKTRHTQWRLPEPAKGAATKTTNNKHSNNGDQHQQLKNPPQQQENQNKNLRGTKVTEHYPKHFTFSCANPLKTPYNRIKV